jgi:simple sugar transport system permease protein
MMSSLESLALTLSAAVNAGTILALAALGLLVSERSGVVNLGAEGLMLLGALAGYATAVQGNGHGLVVAFAAAAGVAALAAAAFGVLVIWLGTNQYATGLALSLFGSGFTAFAGAGYTDRQLPPLAEPGLPHLQAIPFLGTACFRYHPVVYLTVALGVGLVWFLFRSRAGLVLRAVGESPESAHALGHPVRLVRLAAVVFGGALCGLAGAYVSLVYAHLWVEGLIAGKGWIALALTTFATWRPARVLLGAYLFGGVTMLQFQLQGRGVQVESHLLGMLPYLATVLVLVVISRNRAWIRVNMPASLGKPFHPTQ